MIEKKRSSATLIAVFLISLLLLGGADAAPRLIACMSAHQDEMKALNTQIAELQKIRVTPGGPNTKLGDCAHRLETIRGNALPRTADKNSVEQWEAEGKLDEAQRANKIWKKMLADYQPPPIDPGVDEGLREFIEKKKASMPDATH